MHINILKVYISIFNCKKHPASFLKFCLLNKGGERETLPELHQTFEVATAQTSGPVNLVFFCQTGFF